MLDGRVVGRYDEARGAWAIRLRYRPFVRVPAVADADGPAAASGDDAVPPLDRALLDLLRAEASGPVPAGLDWDALCRRAAEQGASAMLHHRVRGREGVPAVAREELRGRYLEAAAGATHRAAQLGRVLALLRGRGIEVAVLKGAYLAEAVYANPALRPMGDVDLLVRREDLGRAKEALLADGFRQGRLAPFEAAVVGLHHLVPFVRDDARALTVEVHAELTPDHVGMLAAAGAWERSRAARVAGVEARALSVEDLILHLAAHACLQHRLGGGLAPLLDVDAILRACGRAIDWDALLERARAEGAGDSAALLLGLAAEFLGAPVPEGIVARLAPAGISAEVRRLALGQLFREAGSAPFVPRTLARIVHARGPVEAARIVRDRLRAPERERRAGVPPGRRALLSAQRAFEVAAMAWRFGRSVARTLAGCAPERRSAGMAMRGEALVRALHRSPGRGISSSGMGIVPEGPRA